MYLVKSGALMLLLHFQFSTSVSLNSTSTPCTFSEELIQEYDNAKGTTPIEAETHVEIGIGKSSSASFDKSLGFENSQSSGSDTGIEAGFNFFGFSTSVKHEVTKSASTSNTTRNSWSLASDDTWNQQSSRTTKYSIPPGFRVKLYQDVARCGSYTVRNSRIRREDEDGTPIEKMIRLQQMELDNIEYKMHNVTSHIDLLREREKQESQLKGLEMELQQNRTLSEIKAKQDELAGIREAHKNLHESILELNRQNQIFLDKFGARRHDLDQGEQLLKENDAKRRHEKEMKEADRRHELEIIRAKGIQADGAGGSGKTEYPEVKESDSEYVRGRQKMTEENPFQGITILYIVLISIGILVFITGVACWFCYCILGQKRPPPSNPNWKV